MWTSNVLIYLCGLCMWPCNAYFVVTSNVNNCCKYMYGYAISWWIPAWNSNVFIGVLCELSCTCVKFWLFAYLCEFVICILVNLWLVCIYLCEPLVYLCEELINWLLAYLCKLWYIYLCRELTVYLRELLIIWTENFRLWKLVWTYGWYLETCEDFWLLVYLCDLLICLLAYLNCNDLNDNIGNVNIIRELEHWSLVACIACIYYLVTIIIIPLLYTFSASCIFLQLTSLYIHIAAVCSFLYDESVYGVGFSFYIWRYMKIVWIFCL